MVFENYCDNVGAGFPRPIASITDQGGEKGATYAVVAVNFQTPPKPG
jgi:hypothetical protein